MAILKVTGMTCSGCVRSVSKAVERAAPGAAPKIDLESGTVSLADDIDLTAVSAAIRKAGYEVAV